MKDKIFNLRAGLHQIAVAAFSCLIAELYLLKELDIC
jgi:hypothetical protein